METVADAERMQIKENNVWNSTNVVEKAKQFYKTSARRRKCSTYKDATTPRRRKDIKGVIKF